MQMDYIGVPINKHIDVLGWVNMDKKRYVIVKLGESYYRAEFITEIKKEVKCAQFPLPDGGWEFPHLTHVGYNSFNRTGCSFVAERKDVKNLKLYEHLVTYKRNTEIAGQIYY